MQAATLTANSGICPQIVLLRVLWVLWVWLTCNGLVFPLFENQPHFLYWSMIRRTRHEFLLQVERSA
jgi:hypothetical protein